ncbi:multidrug-resistance type transporter aminotriazole resistance [Paecilomyces lecythidis]
MAVDNQPQQHSTAPTTTTSITTDTDDNINEDFSKSSVPTDAPIANRPGILTDKLLALQNEHVELSHHANCGSSEDEKDKEWQQQGGGPPADNLARTETNVSIVATMSLRREITFVGTMCIGELFSLAALGQVMSIIHLIGDHFNITEPGELSWLMAGYSLTVGTFILFSGRSGDVYGYKKVLLTGVVWYTLWTLVCGISVYSNAVLFIFSRVFQGIGPAIILPNCVAILGVSYPPGRRKEMVFALFGSMSPTGSIGGSALAAVLALAWWPWAFYAFSIMLAVWGVGCYFIIPAASNGQNTPIPKGFKNTVRELDLIGMFLGVGGLILFNFAWNQAPIVGWEQPYVYVILIIGVMFLTGFCIFERRYAENPLVPFHAFSPDVSFVLGAIACGWSCFGIWYYYCWQFFMVVQGNSPLLATAKISPAVPSGTVAALFTGYMLHHLKPPLVMTMSMCFYLVGSILLMLVPVDQIYWGQMFVAILIIPWGMDMSFPAATIILSDSVERKHQGIAASLVNTFVNYSISLGLGFAGTVEVHVNKGGTTTHDILLGYRGAYYFCTGLAGLGLVITLIYLVKNDNYSSATLHSPPLSTATLASHLYRKLLLTRKDPKSESFRKMSREAYQVPSLGAQNAFGADGLSGASADGPAVTYLCGDCNSKVSLKRGDQIRCKECGHRVLYKERTKRMVQFEAR